jgi:putative iron-dependent peroxidase
MAIPQTMLSVVARDEAHLQFKLKDDVKLLMFFKILGKLSESELTGVADPDTQQMSSVNRRYRKHCSRI